LGGGGGCGFAFGLARLCFRAARAARGSLTTGAGGDWQKAPRHSIPRPPCTSRRRAASLPSTVLPPRRTAPCWAESATICPPTKRRAEPLPASLDRLKPTIVHLSKGTPFSGEHIWLQALPCAVHVRLQPVERSPWCWQLATLVEAIVLDDGE